MPPLLPMSLQLVLAGSRPLALAVLLLGCTDAALCRTIQGEPPALDVEEAPAESASPDRESPWLVTPTMSVDPKLGSTLGGVAGYIRKFDPDSNPSLLTFFGGYSNTDSHYLGFAADTYFKANQHKLIFGAMSGEVCLRPEVAGNLLLQVGAMVWVVLAGELLPHR